MHSQGGGRVGPLSGDTPEADELAQWLRRVTNGWTVRALAGRFPYGRNQWSEFRKGTKLLPGYLLEDVLTVLIKDPRIRQIQLQEGMRLLAAAETAARARSAAVSEQPTGTAIELQLRLDDARRGEIAARDALLGTSRLVYMLLEVVGSLTQRCKALEQERDQARTAVPPVDIRAIQGELDGTKALLDQANDRLAQARREREEAEDLRLLAEQRAEEYRLALEAVNRIVTSATTERRPGDAATGSDDDDRRWQPAEDLHPLWEYEIALEAADEELAAHKSHMAAAREQMGVGTDGAVTRETPTVVPGHVVRADSADSADNEDRPAARTPRTRRPARHQAPYIWGNVPPRNPNFTGRQALLESLHERLLTGTTAVLPQAVHGMGGVGKTQLAVEYVFRYQHEYDIVWWISAERPDRIGPSLAELALRLGLTTEEESHIAGPVVREALREGRPYARWLLVFDNADNPDEVRPYFPPQGEGAVLVTSRNRRWGQFGHSVEVDGLTRQESKDLLLRRVPELGQGDEADALAEALGDLPLALEQAAAWLTVTGMPSSDYLRVIEEARVVPPPGSPPDYPLPVTTAWNVSLDELETRSPSALRLLQLCSHFAPEPISRWLLSAHGADSVHPDLDPLLNDAMLLGRATREVNRYSLARIDHRTNSFQMHRLVQHAVKNGMSPDEQSRMRRGAHTLLAAADPMAPADPTQWPRYAELLPHAMASAVVGSEQPPVRHLVSNLAAYLHHQGDHKRALEFSEHTWQTWRTRFGEEDPLTRSVGQWLGSSYWTAGRFDDAAELAHRLREMQGDDDTSEDALRVLRLTAAVHRAEGAFVTAADVDRTAYERARAAFGEDDPVTLDIAHAVAVNLRLSGDFQQAEELDRRTLVLKRGLFGKGDPSLLITEDGLAVTARESGRYATARRLHQSVHEAYGEAYGRDHPATIEAARQLSESCRKAGDPVRSLELAKHAHTEFANRYERNHPRTLAAELTLSMALRENGDLDAAHRHGVMACQRFRQVYNPRHPHSLSADVDLAVTLRQLGLAQEAHQLDEAALVALGGRLGEAHPLALVCAINLATDLAALGRHEEARRRGEAALQHSRVGFGEEHPNTLVCAGNLALDLVAVGAGTEGTALREDTLRSMERVLESPGLLTARCRSGERIDCDIVPLSL
ncbi:FxSxx-COOH system tetratricopeptide repeat protein [Streptomyces antibioticus]|uniref:FxSxx-COOH system tetratricopeptide repeat protein n=1 Tax=Streptomyces antibioticus TaxID=1890 RepID=UPI0033BAEE1C